MAAARFCLVKWYLDCVTDAGEVAILYSARAEWRRLRLAYSSFLCIEGETRIERSSMRAAKIVHHQGQIAASAPQLGICGEWTATAGSVEQTVYKNDDGSVIWNCLQPAAKVSLKIGKGNLSGLGYAECLRMTLPAWKLPLRHLRWGRFVSPRDALAWIDWQGPHSTRFVIHNGMRIDEATVSATEISCRSAVLQMGDAVSIRSGLLGSTVLPGAPALAKIFPRSMFNVDEKKWLSRGVLETANHNSRGWVIHETVDWKG